jgi:hypothetical protein
MVNVKAFDITLEWKKFFKKSLCISRDKYQNIGNLKKNKTLDKRIIIKIRSLIEKISSKTFFLQKYDSIFNIC